MEMISFLIPYLIDEETEAHKVIGFDKITRVTGRTVTWGLKPPNL